MERAERSWYLEQLGIPEWIPRDAAAPVTAIASVSAEAAGVGIKAVVAVAEQALAADPLATTPVPASAPNGVGPGDILAKLRASNGPKTKRQVDGESQLAEEFTRPPTAEQLKQLAAIPMVTPVVEAEPDETVPIQAASLPAANSIPTSKPEIKVAAKQQVPNSGRLAKLPQQPAVDSVEPDFSIEEPDFAELQALFAESLQQEESAQPEVDAGPDDIEKLARDWKLVLTQAACLPACLGEGAAEPAVIVLTALPANQFDNRQLDRAWRLRRSILKAAKLPEKATYHSSFYSISNNVKPARLLKRLRDLYPQASLLCFANLSLEADVKGLEGDVVCLPSLDLMLADAALKRQAWKKLQAMIPSFEKLA
jgi:hypothetical protein